MLPNTGLDGTRAMAEIVPAVTLSRLNHAIGAGEGGTGAARRP